jgi:hypothetical protein
MTVLVTLIISSCGNGTSGWQETSLLEHGIPITILAPDSMTVKRSNIAFQEDITMKADDGFNIQIFVSDAMVSSISAAVASQKESVKSNPYFDSILSEDEGGFVFKNQIDSTHASFGFRHVRLMGGKEYIFQEGMLGSFTEVEARKMYEAVSHQ